MELSKDLTKEQMKNGLDRCQAVGLPRISNPLNLDSSLTEDQVIDRVEKTLQDEMQAGNQPAIFQLGQYYFEQKRYKKALHYFEMLSNRGDWQATFQLGVMHYDGLGVQQDAKRGFELMYKVATSSSPETKHLIHAAQYNIGRAYFHGFGVKRSEQEAERFWLLAADDGNPKASVKAQSTLGLFYSGTDNLDLKKAFYWHTEATGNGSLESQGALGVMYMEGLGRKKDAESAFVCFREAAKRGNVYAAGHLTAFYYQRRLYTKTVELASQVAQLSDVDAVALEIDCLSRYISKGIAMAAFYYGRCLALGRGVSKDEAEAKKYYSLSYKFDARLCAKLQAEVQHGNI